MKKKYIYIVVIIIVIAAGVIIGVNIKDNTKETSSRNVTNTNDGNNKVIVNQTINHKENNIENEIEQNTEDNNIAETPVADEEKFTPKTDLEKAMDIVKKDWGEDSSVYFAQDGQTQSGEYIICVRDTQTTNALAWYTVNTETGEFEKE